MVKISPSHAGSVCSIPGQGARMLHAFQVTNQSIEQNQYCNKFKKHLKKKKGHYNILHLNLVMYMALCVSHLVMSDSLRPHGL